MDQLEHHGVKGQKWGVRRADKKFEKRAGSFDTKIAVHNHAAHIYNSVDVSHINNKPKYVAAHDRGDFLDGTKAITQQYTQEHANAFNKRLQESADSMTNRSGTRKYKVHIHPDGDWHVSSVDVNHADDSVVKIKITKGPKGKILKATPASGNMAQGSLAVGNILSHHGIKGMKWGVRRRNIGTPHEVTVKSTSGRKVKTTGGEGHPHHTDAVNAAKIDQQLKKSGKSSLSNDDLQKLALRLNLEHNVDQARAKTSGSPVKRYVAKHLAKAGGQAVNQAASAAVSKQVGDLLKKTHKVATS